MVRQHHRSTPMPDTQQPVPGCLPAAGNAPNSAALEGSTWDNEDHVAPARAPAHVMPACVTPERSHPLTTRNAPERAHPPHNLQVRHHPVIEPQQNMHLFVFCFRINTKSGKVTQ